MLFFILILQLFIMQALREIYITLTKDPIIQQFINFMDQVVQQISLQNHPQELQSSAIYQELCKKLQKLKFDKLEQNFHDLPDIPKLTGLIIKATKDFTVAFLMMPRNYSYGWHDHKNINGLSKCICGEITIETINPKFLQEQLDERGLFDYPVAEVRKEKLNPSEDKISCIYPNSYNIHKIVAGKQQAAFIDIMLPEYPDDNCNHYKQVQSKSDELMRFKLEQNQLEEIMGLEGLIKLFRKSTKPKQ